MENIDERDIDAARFEKKILQIWSRFHDYKPEEALRLTIFLLFSEWEVGSPLRSGPWGPETARHLIGARSEMAHRLGLKDDDRVAEEWQRLPLWVLEQIRDLVADNSSPEVTLKRLDFLVKRLSAISFSNSDFQKVESFVASFVSGLSDRSPVVMDLNMTTTGELGVRLNELETSKNYLRHMNYILPYDFQPNFFEVCLRLYAHGVPFNLAGKRELASHWEHINVACRFTYSPRNRPVENLHNSEWPLDLSGLEFAQWCLEQREAQDFTIIVLPTADLRAKGRRAAIRHTLLSHISVLGIVDIPDRVFHSKRLSIMILSTKQSYASKPVLLMNGRAVDGLRDEPLDRLARFLSLPFMNMMRGSGTNSWDSDIHLGDVLTNRARKMYGTDTREIPGFFRYVTSEEILHNHYAVLDPAEWIPERDPIVASDLLDGTPVRKLLAEREQARCVYVIGNNGSGKSMLLRQLAKACVASGRPVRAIAFATSDRFETKMGATTDYVYLGARTSERSTQPHKLGRKLAELMIAIHANRAKLVALNKVLEQLSFAGQHYLLPETASSDILESVHQLSGNDSRLNLDGWKLGFRKTNENSIIPFDHLSTGEQQLLLLTTRLVEYAHPSVVFLIDEPETSLHVAWQRALPAVFQAISQNFNCQMVIATHSPILISSAHGKNTFRFLADGGVLEIIDKQAASSVERVLFQGFNTYTENNREVHERCAELVSQAIEFANTERLEMLSTILDELRQMQKTVAKSILALGPEAPAFHLDLIRKAMLAITELAFPKSFEGPSL